MAINYVTRETDANSAVEALTAMGRRAFAVRANVSKDEEIAQLFARVGAEWGGLDIYHHQQRDRRYLVRPGHALAGRALAAYD